jgi:hypothetical protein
MRAIVLGVLISSAICLSGTKCSAQVQISDFSSTLSNPTTPPAVEAALSAAQQPQNQAVASKVFCYCGCDREHGHQSLLDCYRTGHIPVCKTCQSEFIRVGQMTSQGATLGQIQSDIDRQWAGTYPYPQPSLILRNYMAGRAYVAPM